MTVQFTTDGYCRMIGALRRKGYSVRGYADVNPAERHLVLRHDVDLSLESAVRMGEIEEQLGVQSTYFVLVRSTFYNLFSTKACAAMQRLLSLGHSIGLHFDPKESDSTDMEGSIATEAKILALACDSDIAAVSFHRPISELLRGPEKFGGLWNAYSKRFMEEVGYCSDSRGEWRHGDPLSHAAVREGRALQLLTHPIWWNEVEVAPSGRLERFLDEKATELSRQLAANSTVYLGSAE
jgi:hypothetical protein